MALTKEQILAADDLGLLEMKVKEWGGSVFIRVMSCGERDAYENEWVAAKAKNSGVANFRTKFLARCLCDDKGERLFTDAEVEQLAKKSARVMSRVWAKAMEHNALTENDVEELAKN
jgi:hypothetical protein